MVLLVIDRLRRSRLVDTIVLATTIDPSDDKLVGLVEDHGIDVVRGPVLDVLERYGLVADRFAGADTIVRVTADCPFVDPDVVDDVIRLLRRTGADFASNRLPPPHRRTFPVGLDVEVCTRAALMEARSLAVKKHHREHVMPFLYETEKYRVEILDLEVDQSVFRWTVDTPQDLEAVRAIASRASSKFASWEEFAAVVTAEPELMKINGGVIQKELSEIDTRWASNEA